MLQKSQLQIFFDQLRHNRFEHRNFLGRRYVLFVQFSIVLDWEELIQKFHSLDSHVLDTLFGNDYLGSMSHILNELIDDVVIVIDDVDITTFTSLRRLLTFTCHHRIKIRREFTEVNRWTNKREIN